MALLCIAGMARVNCRLSSGAIMAKRQIPLALPGEILPEKFLEPLAENPATIHPLAAAA
jgi:hypothetical protein